MREDIFADSFHLVYELVYDHCLFLAIEVIGEDVVEDDVEAVLEIGLNLLVLDEVVVGGEVI